MREYDRLQIIGEGRLERLVFSTGIKIGCVIEVSLNEKHFLLYSESVANKESTNFKKTSTKSNSNETNTTHPKHY